MDGPRFCSEAAAANFDGQSPHSVVIMDNASIHHINSVIHAINVVGALVRFLPPYSPDLNPCFWRVKAVLASK